MEIKKEILLKLIQDRFRDNQGYFADSIGISREHVNRLLNSKTTEIIKSEKLCNNLIAYCISNEWEYQSLFIL